MTPLQNSPAEFDDIFRGTIVNQATISKREMNLILGVIREKYLALESMGTAGTDEYSSLRSLEDRLGSLNGKSYQVTPVDYGTEFPSHSGG